jgi:hypothetical protein
MLRVRSVVEGVTGDVPVDERHRMLLEVATDVRVVKEDIEAVLPQMIGRTDPGEHEQLWRSVCARGEDHLSRGPDGASGVLDPNSAAVRDEDATCVGTRLDRQVLALSDRLQKRVRNAVTPSVARRRLKKRGTVHLRTVVIVDLGNAGSDGSVDERPPIS